MRLRQLVAGALSLGLFGMGGSAFGAAWVPSSGSTSAYSYAGGGDDNGKFGTPAAKPGGFAYTPAAFNATSAGGVVTNPGSITTDRSFVTVMAPGAAKTLKTITLTESGDYTIFNGGGVQVTAGLFIRVLDAVYPGTAREFSTMMVTPGMPVTTAGTTSGTWNGLASITLPFAANQIEVVFDDHLQTYSSASGSAFIAKKFANLNLNVPEPISATTLIAGVSLLAARRRKA